MMKRIIVLIFLVLCLSSCLSSTDKQLLDSIQNAEYENLIQQKKNLTNADIWSYCNMELQYNKQYVQDLEKLINDAFEKQLSDFETEELGFFSSYSNMFKSIFKSKPEFQNELRLKAERYFGSLNLEQDIYKLNNTYKENISILRKTVISKDGIIAIPTVTDLQIPQMDVVMSSVIQHGKKNFAIELGTEIFQWLLGLLIMAIICAILGIAMIWKPIGWVGLAVCCVTILTSTVLSIKNDNKLLDDLRAQNKKEITINASQIQQSIDKNTIQFYEKYGKIK